MEEDPMTPATVPAIDLSPTAQVINFPKRGGRRTSRGKTYPPDPLLAEDVAHLVDACVPTRPGAEYALTAGRLRALIAVLYRSGLRVNEALALVESDLHRDDGALLVRHGKGDKRRISVMDQWGWRELERWMMLRAAVPDGYVFPVIRGATAGGKWSDHDVRRQLHELGATAGVRKRVAPHQFRHGHAVELWREGLDVYTIQQQLGHANLNVTARYLRGVDPLQVLQPITQRKPPMITIS